MLVYITAEDAGSQSQRRARLPVVEKNVLAQIVLTYTKQN